MALTREEELELQKLEEEQSVLTSELDEIRKQLAAEAPPVAPPAPEVEPVETGFLEAGVRGAAQGLTFGTADEIAAGLESTFTDKPYEQALEESRAEYKAAEQQYPLTTLGGEIAGGVGQGLALTAAAGPAGAATAGANAVGKLRRAAQIAKGIILPSKEAGAVKNIAKIAGSGAAIGGATAVGKSEEEGLARLKDAPAGAVSGGVIGGAIGGVGAGLGKAGQMISKSIDEGNMPYSVKMIRDAWRQGLEGQGFISMKDKKKVTDEFFQAADDAVNRIKDTTEELTTLKNEILRNVEPRININDEITEGINKLRELKTDGVKDAKELLVLLSNSSKSIAGNRTTVPVYNASNLVRRIRDAYSKETSREVKQALDKVVSEINKKIRVVVTPTQIEKSLKKIGSPEIDALYNKYLNPQSASFIPDNITSGDIKEDELFFKPFKKALKTRLPEDIKAAERSAKGTMAALRREVKPKAPKYSSDATAQEMDDMVAMLDDAAKDSPFAKLDSSLNSLLNAQELLGIQGTTKSVPGKSAARMKVFSNLRSQTADTGSGEKAYKLYSEALEEMRKSYSPLAQEVEQITKKPIEKLEVKKFLEGAKLGDSSKETGLIKSVVGAAGQIAATGANVAGQIKSAASRGASGPIPGLPTSLATRPVVRTLTVAKQSIDDVARANPNSPVWKYMGEQIDQALATKDEVRRAAILNSLMQYESFRKMIGEDWNKKEE